LGEERLSAVMTGVKCDWLEVCGQHTNTQQALVQKNTSGFFFFFFLCIPPYVPFPSFHHNTKIHSLPSNEPTSRHKLTNHVFSSANCPALFYPGIPQRLIHWETGLSHSFSLQKAWFRIPDGRTKQRNHGQRFFPEHQSCPPGDTRMDSTEA